MHRITTEHVQIQPNIPFSWPIPRPQAVNKLDSSLLNGNRDIYRSLQVNPIILLT